MTEAPVVSQAQLNRLLPVNRHFLRASRPAFEDCVTDYVILDGVSLRGQDKRLVARVIADLDKLAVVEMDVGLC